MKTLITTLALAGSLVLGGCGDKEKVIYLKQNESAKYDSLKSKYNDLCIEKDFWIQKYADCQGENTQNLIREIKVFTGKDK